MQEKRFALGKIVALIIFCVCLMSLSVGIVFAYVPTLSFKSGIAPVLSSCSLSHQGKVLYNTAGDINSVVGTTDSATGKTYIVKPISANTVQVKCAYQYLTKTSTTSDDITSNEISFSSTGKNGQIVKVVTYGVDITSNTDLCEMSSAGTSFTVTLKTSSSFTLANGDEIILNIQFS